MTDGKVTHSIPVGALVEVTEGLNAGVRLWVVRHEKPAPPALYRLGTKSELPGVQTVLPDYFTEGRLRVIHDPDPILDEAINCNQTEAC